MNVIDIIAGKNCNKTLSDICDDSGGNSSQLKIALKKNGNFISTCIMAKFIQMRHDKEFYELNQEQQLMKCVNLMNEMMGEILSGK